MAHGGKRLGAGRKKKFPDAKPLRVTKLPEDVADWLDRKPKVVEALTNYEFREQIERQVEDRNNDHMEKY